MKIKLIIILGSLLVFSTHAITTNITASTDQSAYINNSTSPLILTDSTLVGGNAVSATGGQGLLANDPGSETIAITNSLLQGGNGGVNIVSVPGGGVANVNGGYGYKDEGVAVDISINTTTFLGGSGGDISQGSGGDALLQAHGGDGVNIERGDLSYSSSLTPSSIAISSGNFTGGSGGTFSSGRLAQDPSFNYNNSLLNLSGARGGHGFRFTRLDQSTPTIWFGAANDDAITIDNGVFIGGDGGIATNLVSGSGLTITAEGGSGLFADYADIIINGGEFSGGIGGTTNGVLNRSGAGIHVQDSNLTINDGFFTNGIGLRVENRYYAPINIINGGTFDTIEYISNFDDFDSAVGSNRTTFADIRGGSISSIDLSGVTFNDITIGGINNPTIGTITLDSSSTGTNLLKITDGADISNINVTGSGHNNISISNTVVLSGTTTIDNGTTIIDSWSNDHFNDVLVNNGLIHFQSSTLPFELSSGGNFAVNGSSATLRIDNLLTLSNNSILTINEGQIEVNDLVTDAGSKVISVFSGGGGVTPKGQLFVTNTASLNADTTWEIVDDGTITLSDVQGLSSTNGFLLVSANKGGITNNLDALDIVFTNTQLTSEWAYGISGLNVVTNDPLRDELHATYGLAPWTEVFDAASGELEELANTLQSVDTGNTILTLMNDKYSSLTEASSSLIDTFLRNTEMAHALTGVQSVFSDQVNLRTEGYRSKFYFNSMPKGPHGPSRPPVRKPYISGISSGNQFFDRYQIPNSYQAWGRAYVSDLNQKSQAASLGYDAQVVGGILGFDKKYNNTILGIAGGFADTDVKGFFTNPNTHGNNGKAKTLHTTGYASVFTDTFFLDTHVNYASSSVKISGPSSTGYTGDYSAHNLSFYLGFGNRLFIGDKFSLIPECSLLSSLYSRDSYISSSTISGLPDKSYDDYDQWSHQVEVGLTFALVDFIDNFRSQIAFQPEFRVHWLHEFNDQFDPEVYVFEGTSLSASLATREESLLRVGLGVNMWDWNYYNSEFGFDIDVLSSSSYEEYTFSGSFIHRF